MSMCKDLTQRTTDFQKAIVNSQLHNRCSRDSSEILQKVQRGECPYICFSVHFCLMNASVCMSISVVPFLISIRDGRKDRRKS